jgi:Rrf2 family protein
MVIIRDVRMTEGVEWGLHAAVLLALAPEGVGLPAARIAEFHGVAAPYLAKHLQALARAGVLDSVPGARGGYRLARPADEITVREVVEAIDGPAAAFRCTEIRRRGPVAGPPGDYTAPCAIHAVMVRADSAWRAELARTTVADLATNVVTTSSPSSLREGARWFADVTRTGGAERR